MSIPFKYFIRLEPTTSWWAKWQSEKLKKFPPKYGVLLRIFTNGWSALSNDRFASSSPGLLSTVPANCVIGPRPENIFEARASIVSFKIFTCRPLMPGNLRCSSSKIKGVSKIHLPWLQSIGTVGFPRGCNRISHGSFSNAYSCVYKSLKGMFISIIAISTLAQYEHVFINSPVFLRWTPPVPSTMASYGRNCTSVWSTTWGWPPIADNDSGWPNGSSIRGWLLTNTNCCWGMAGCCRACDLGVIWNLSWLDHCFVSNDPFKAPSGFVDRLLIDICSADDWSFRDVGSSATVAMLSLFGIVGLKLWKFFEGIFVECALDSLFSSTNDFDEDTTYSE